MSAVVVIAIASALAGCGPPPAMMTAPGTALPTFLSACTAEDSVQRCTRWTPATETCVNPLGLQAEPPTVPCATIRRKPS